MLPADCLSLVLTQAILFKSGHFSRQEVYLSKHVLNACSVTGTTLGIEDTKLVKWFGVEEVGQSKPTFSIGQCVGRKQRAVEAKSGTSNLEVQRRLPWGLSPVSEDVWAW